MVDLQTVCCMCGDVGFTEKLFHCSKCRRRFQHSYCSNYYSQLSEPIHVCDWCQCEDRNSTSTAKTFSPSSSRKSITDVRSAHSGEKIKQNQSDESSGSGFFEKVAGKTPSPRPTTRRYKLLKDVMC
ncbi:hypothetical protein M569_14719 [Genlisea aurea]|uniref:PHD-type zinc finger plants domain-containing protein n=1 Tax=Genlisea aurea TaxID=192259 RepID=S8BZQ5_9LAMI|nr:hypothetical protein M569_14719 [Genlisea aurea]